MTPPGEPGTPAGRPPRTDVAVAAALLAAGLAEVWFLPGGGSPWWGSAAVATATVPLAWRRRAPLTVAVAVALGIGVAAPASALVQFLAVLVAAFGVAAYAPFRSAVLGLTAILLAQTTAILVGPDSSVANVAYAVGLYGGAWLAGLAVRRRATQADTLRALARQLREEQETLAGMVVAAERSRIARELHDVIAHSVSVMVVQAGAAEQLLSSDPARARRALEAVQDTGAQAAAELRRLLGVLRAGPDDEGLTPAPGLADVPRLLDRLRLAGLDVEHRTEGTARPLPPGVDLAAYRVVQEAATNVLKHAAASRVTVTVRHTAADVTVTVQDDGRARPQGAVGGHGLVGLRERCVLYGGVLRVDAGPAGFTVEACLPRGDAAGTAPLPATADQEARP
ncbi:sensor histidine kinase [Geodermatophilus sp. URMC 64]